jgi:transposase
VWNPGSPVRRGLSARSRGPGPTDVQRRLESYDRGSGLVGDFVTITRDPLGSRIHRRESPTSTPKTSTTVDGTVVRSESERRSVLTSLDSMGLDKGPSLADGVVIDESCGLHVRQHVGSNLKYSHVVGQHVGRHMLELPERMPSRERAALKMLLAGIRVAEGREPGEYLVPSQSRDGFYRVKLEVDSVEGVSCTCKDFLDRMAPCKHIYVVRHWVYDTPEDRAAWEARVSGLVARPKRDPRYSLALQEEGRLFPILLRELCAGIGEPSREPGRAGRPSIPLRDQAFCALQKIETTLSARRTKERRVEAAMAGKIDSVPYFDVVSKFLLRPESTPILMDMIARSALPLKAIEDRCAADSTGFRTTRFHHYREEKYNPTRRNIWRKLHALVGIRTHAIIAAEVTDGSVADVTILPILLQRAKDAGFSLTELLADRAYNARKIFQVAEDLGITAVIPFKSNQTGQSKGCPAYHRMYLFFSYDREKFDEHYRDRAQVEVTFGAIKQVIGETILSRKFTAQVNEVLGKAVVHNIRMLIHAMFTLGALPDFLQPKNAPGTEAILHEFVVPDPNLSFNHAEGAIPVVLSATSK